MAAKELIGPFTLMASTHRAWFAEVESWIQLRTRLQPSLKLRLDKTARQVVESVKGPLEPRTFTKLREADLLGPDECA
jgi:hypothetical protein